MDKTQLNNTRMTSAPGGPNGLSPRHSAAINMIISEHVVPELVSKATMRRHEKNLKKVRHAELRARLLRFKALSWMVGRPAL